MKLEHLVVATDASEVGRGAHAAALDLAARASARVTVMRAIAGRRVPVGAHADGSAAELERLEEWVSSVAAPRGVSVKLGLEFGHPSVEIPRFAEANAADLIVIGRKPRTQAVRFRAGDTADAVVRRSRLPPVGAARGAASAPGARCGGRLASGIEGLRRRERICAPHRRRLPRGYGGASRGEDETPDLARRAPRVGTAQLRSEIGARLSVRRGSVFEQVLAEIHDTGADLLAIGNQRGGPPGVLELGSVGRHLAHAAPCAVLTIPL